MSRCSIQVRSKKDQHNRKIGTSIMNAHSQTEIRKIWENCHGQSEFVDHTKNYYSTKKNTIGLESPENSSTVISFYACMEITGALWNRQFVKFCGVARIFQNYLNYNFFNTRCPNSQHVPHIIIIHIKQNFYWCPSRLLIILVSRMFVPTCKEKMHILKLASTLYFWYSRWLEVSLRPELDFGGMWDGHSNACDHHHPSPSHFRTYVPVLLFCWCSVVDFKRAHYQTTFVLFLCPFFEVVLPGICLVTLERLTQASAPPFMCSACTPTMVQTSLNSAFLTTPSVPYAARRADSPKSWPFIQTVIPNAFLSDYNLK